MQELYNDFIGDLWECLEGLQVEADKKGCDLMELPGYDELAHSADFVKELIKANYPKGYIHSVMFGVFADFGKVKERLRNWQN